MTNEELENVMNFIIERQERFADQQTHQQMLVDTLLESQNTLTATVLQITEAHNARINRLDEHDRRQLEIIEAHNARFDRHDDGFKSMRESIDNLSRTVDRYITARGNGSNGANG
jgi:hypothetical protein